MNDELNSMSSDDPRWLDQLVDGELSESQRRQLLIELENSSDGWRRCALAFLEAQAWKDSLSGVVAAASQDTVPRPARGASWYRGSWGTMLAAAASFLMAFALGLAWRGQAVRPEPENMAQAPTSKSLAPTHSGSPADSTLWGTMTVSVDRNNDGQPESVELPVARGPGIDEQWVRNQPLAIPDHVLRELERRGHEVRHERQYYPFDLGDGGRVLVPVDELNVRYVSERQFQ